MRGCRKNKRSLQTKRWKTMTEGKPQKGLVGAYLQQESFGRRLWRDLYRNRWVYLIALVCLSWYFIFCYAPMGGIVMAFKDYRPARGLWKSTWLGLKWFQEFTGGYYFTRLVRNTLVINSLGLAIGFTMPIILALLINEIHNSRFKRTVQTITYLPHFVSTVVACGLVVNLLSYNGLLNQITGVFGKQPKLWLSTPQYFPWIYEFSGLWQELGFNSIIFLAALSSIDSQLLDAAAIDGCNRFQRVWHVHIPGILPTILLLLIMRVGSMMSVGYERIILLYNEATYETADVMSSFVYRQGILGGSYSYGATVDLFNGVINLVLLAVFNGISRRVSEISLW